MKVPEPLFVFINPVMRVLLRSPLHRLLSSSIMLVRFNGRKTGRIFVTPVRYLRDGNRVYCYSNKGTQWWRNLRNNGTAWLTVAGHESRYLTRVIEDDPGEVRAALEVYFRQFPQDAAYHDVRLDRDKRPNATDMDRAAVEAIIVEARPVEI